MEVNLSPGIDTGKILNVRYLLTTLVVVLIVVWVASRFISPTLTDASGKETGKLNLKFTNPLKK